MDNVLQDIIMCEEEAARLEEEAKSKSLELLTKARKKAEDILENSLVEGESMVDHILKKAQSEADDERKLNENAYMSQDEQSRMKSKESLNEAADFIVGRVVSKSWQW